MKVILLFAACFMAFNGAESDPAPIDQNTALNMLTALGDNANAQLRSVLDTFTPKILALLDQAGGPTTAAGQCVQAFQFKVDQLTIEANTKINNIMAGPQTVLMNTLPTDIDALNAFVASLSDVQDSLIGVVKSTQTELDHYVSDMQQCIPA